MPKIVLCVSGSIASYKALELVRELKKEGFDVWVAMTKNAQKFVAPVSFETLSGHPVFVELFPKHQTFPIHIELNANTDALIVAPATANIIAKTYSGIADDLVSTLILSSTAPKIFVPAMNEAMWISPVTQRNVNYLKTQGYYFIEPEVGELACEKIGKGRFPRISEILKQVKEILFKPQPLHSKKIVLTAGRTEEELDPIRVLTNRASGKIGLALAQAFCNVGAEVSLILGGTTEITLAENPRLKIKRVLTNSDLTKILLSEMKSADVLIMACAVCDYTIKRKSQRKIKSEEFNITLKKTPDILKLVCEKFPNVLTIGFSVDTHNKVRSAIKKLKEKRLDYIIQNPPETIGSDQIQATIISKDLKIKKLPIMSKLEFAQQLVKLVTTELVNRSTEKIDKKY
ncbi:MAG: bifunctional phosphopantothenoylcysteine decarboxylase/phosphopantothenate--cysteine ligase CoaBC [candidate division WOR-3 bacterium]|nr:bifunctional phosphopantothenoylcysteine decarboxylase/phosphopantothenate--cysteine ligase CoaBC [candidate division WOR-3 bacterium]MCX7756842.1 bifunctional phosphopantothenoylcysteine decarboxylase/phosphopantothenate--cysteine ligase CoaBC [candidate division WOR-3 bacterium]MDW7988164.1 bifunctional phosphopantothenoylcysteine decarboxylase/phosphopantothenate--cysteine ligase CoaBC [candidate division WOR-3 bacterium]